MDSLVPPHAHAASAHQRHLVDEHLPLVRAIVHRIGAHLPQHVELRDLEHAGVLGLIDAARRFDPLTGVQFSTFAGHRIRGSILDCLRALDWAPRRLRRAQARIEEARLALRRELEREPDHEELARHLGLSLEEVERHMAQMDTLNVLRLDAPVRSEDGGAVALAELVPDTGHQGAEEAASANEMLTLLARAIEVLPDREQNVLRLYYYDELTLKEIGTAMGVTESRICQIRSAALARLRSRMQRAANP